MRDQDRYRPIMTARLFDAAVAQTRLQKRAIIIGRDYLVNGLTLLGTAKRHGVTPDRVRQIVGRIVTAKPSRRRSEG
jgi:hypothetical protein